MSMDHIMDLFLVQLGSIFPGSPLIPIRLVDENDESLGIPKSHSTKVAEYESMAKLYGNTSRSLTA